ncbi:hypothetical protein PI87_12505 [Ralstonia sp. A12]|uniref:PIN domain-containing protein n=1 Tax=Ralstonia sp. A12 TaxID=1217052 RepID=UPI0005756B22|nr:PIN domain-containing protein [Ralstonia sp. A12]KHK55821.1 hypothetical protein PI87_12505 [Ralstonia sp. A12]
MRKEFNGHFPVEQGDIDSMMREAWFVFDTNVLLNLYRYSESTRDDYFGLLAKIGARVRIPFQVAAEFFDNRIKVISDQNAIGGTLEKALRGAHNKARSDLESMKRHAQINIVKLIAELDRSFEAAVQEVMDLKKRRPPIEIMSDPILEKLARLLEGRVRDEPSVDKVPEIEKWAKQRLEEKVPPGFADSEKQSGKKFGDAKIWWDILQLGRASSKPVIFVTDDVKEDWWLRVDGKIIGPLPQLRQEYRRVTGQEFHMYQADQFLQHASAFFKTSVEQASVSEVTEVRDRLATEELEDHRLAHLHEAREEYASKLRDASDRLQRLRARFGSEKNEKADRVAKDIEKDLLKAKESLDYVDHLIARTLAIRKRRLGERQLVLDINSNKYGVTKILAQQFYEQGDEFYEMGAPELVEFYPAEIEMLETSGGIEWVERLGGFYGIAGD